MITEAPRADGLSDIGVQKVFCAVVVSRLTYMPMAWSGFVTAADLRVDSFLRRSKCCEFYPSDLPDFDEQLAECDDRLFNRICRNPQHVVHSLLLPPSATAQN